MTITGRILGEGFGALQAPEEAKSELLAACFRFYSSKHYVFRTGGSRPGWSWNKHKTAG
jgi:hypothetical protein